MPMPRPKPMPPPHTHPGLSLLKRTKTRYDRNVVFVCACVWCCEGRRGLAPPLGAWGYQRRISFIALHGPSGRCPAPTTRSTRAPFTLLRRPHPQVRRLDKPKTHKTRRRKLISSCPSSCPSSGSSSGRAWARPRRRRPRPPRRRRRRPWASWNPSCSRPCPSCPSWATWRPTCCRPCRPSWASWSGRGRRRRPWRPSCRRPYPSCPFCSCPSSSCRPSPRTGRRAGPSPRSAWPRAPAPA
mmetsp:Transcript_35250/g.110987  ORF Transcript_35250/g.110987 Transcript_35250/m.110987 type:complete len:241 (+) Transcript_35250:289-1011(+)